MTLYSNDQSSFMVSYKRGLLSEIPAASLKSLNRQGYKSHTR